MISEVSHEEDPRQIADVEAIPLIRHRAIEVIYEIIVKQ